MPSNSNDVKRYDHTIREDIDGRIIRSSMEPEIDGIWIMATEIEEMAWLITHYETVYDPGAATKEDRERGDMIYKKACSISPPETTNAE